MRLALLLPAAALAHFSADFWTEELYYNSLVMDSLSAVEAAPLEDSDARPDLVFAAGSDEVVGALLSSDNFTTYYEVDDTFVDQPRYVAIGDLDGDGVADIVARESQGANICDVWAYYGVADSPGEFSAGTRLISGGPYSQARMTVADLNGDGDADILLPYDELYVLWGPAHDSLETLSDLAEDPTFAVVADMDGDGDLDIVTESGTTQVLSMRNDGAGAFTVVDSAAFDEDVRELAAADMDGDGDFDVLVPSAGSWDGGVYLLENTGAGLFASTVELIGGAAHAEQAVPADWDMDGDMDVFVVCDGRAMRLFEWDQADDSWALVSITSTFADRGVALDYDDDGDLDLVYDRSSSDQIRLLGLVRSAGGWCAAAADCEDGLLCRDSTCSACDSGAQDGFETDVDCGGGDCPACADGESCLVDADCVSPSWCSGGVCWPSSSSSSSDSGSGSGSWSGSWSESGSGSGSELDSGSGSDSGSVAVVVVVVVVVGVLVVVAVAFVLLRKMRAQGGRQQQRPSRPAVEMVAPPSKQEPRLTAPSWQPPAKVKAVAPSVPTALPVAAPAPLPVAAPIVDEQPPPAYEAEPVVGVAISGADNFCAECGLPLKLNARFCSGCGTQV